ncbi:hypothetical protein PIB30_034661 [Stylosanthes scabra]|uniref:Uncharacterized protein n=1 Tax=Stylosanthes scabra TaxID=79078 RepID=A0ABU6QCS5_9FABA|nr:hypothetical protein [Stylosanthes scabra]
MDDGDAAGSGEDGDASGRGGRRQTANVTGRRRRAPAAVTKTKRVSATWRLLRRRSAGAICDGCWMNRRTGLRGWPAVVIGLSAFSILEVTRTGKGSGSRLDRSDRPVRSGSYNYGHNLQHNQINAKNGQTT